MELHNREINPNLMVFCICWKQRFLPPDEVGELGQEKALSRASLKTQRCWATYYRKLVIIQTGFYHFSHQSDREKLRKKIVYSTETDCFKLR